MKILQTIKDYFAPAYSVKYANPVEDVKILSAIGREAVFLTARNGKNYFYYFPATENNLSLAKYLLVRNGIPAKSHITTYHYKKEPCLRVLAKSLGKNTPARRFVDSIDVYQARHYTEINERLEIIRQQMQGRVK